MSDIINLLPDSVANQIAAGEVIQRPASVVKELVENAIDAGAESVKVIIKDAGKTLIQVIDDGKGMSETDARMSFERHATSKISKAEDLFAIRSMGFRGEALASIAAVAQVEMKTRQETSELGTFIEIAGSRVFNQEKISCEKGTNIAVKNLFFNVPARRRFLKTTSTEMMHIRNEFYRIVLVHPDVSFSLYDGDTEVYQLPVTSLKLRLEFLFDQTARKKMDQQLLPIEVDTSLLSMKGFVGRPEFAQKSAHQYFFVNGRYMRHPYFHKAVMVAYENLIKSGENPNYFIYFEVDPATVDINVHPQKTELKFENEKAIWSIILAAVKEALGKFQVAPTLDFDQPVDLDIPVFNRNTPVNYPKSSFNPDYNPFETTKTKTNVPKRADYDWEKLYGGIKTERSVSSMNFDKPKFDSFEDETQQEMELKSETQEMLQLKNRYILSGIKSGLMLIDQHRAHYRILFDKVMANLNQQKGVTQRSMFPEVLELNSDEMELIKQIFSELQWVGFDMELFGKDAYSVNGVPAEMKPGSTLPLLKEILNNIKESEITAKETVHKKIAMTVAKNMAIPVGKKLNSDEMKQLFTDLFHCAEHQYTPDGKLIISIIANDEIERKF